MSKTGIFTSSLAALLAILLTVGFPTTVFARELAEPCGLSEKELARKLKYELVQYAEDFLLAEKKHGINGAFLAAIASLESGHGRYMFRENNIFGWGRKNFNSVPECIDFVAEQIKENYIEPDGKYFRGGTIEAIGQIYCPNDDGWVEIVSELFNEISEGKPKMKARKTFEVCEV